MSRFRNRLLRNPFASASGEAVKTASLSLQTLCISLDDSLQTCATVKDGIAAIANAFSLAAEMNNPGETEESVRELRLIGEAGVFDLELAGRLGPFVCEAAIPIGSTPCIRMLNVKIGDVRAPEFCLCLVSRLKDGNRFLIPNPAVPMQRYRIAQLPHTRKSVRMEALEDSERDSFLREAEALKCVRPERAELLAVFRHVPIEVLSRLRFVAETKIIRFSVVEGLAPTITRVHDMAAVRDKVSGEVFLIPHRAQFRAVALN